MSFFVEGFGRMPGMCAASLSHFDEKTSPCSTFSFEDFLFPQVHVYKKFTTVLRENEVNPKTLLCRFTYL